MGKTRGNAENFSPYRLIFVFSLISLIFLLLAARVVIIQAINPDYYIKKSNISLTHKINIPAKRGEIEDRNGEKLAITIPYKKICVKPQLIKDKEKVIDVVLEIAGIRREEVEKLINKNTGYVVLARGLSNEKARMIKAAASEDWLWLEDDYQRYYPYSSLACQVIGFVSKNLDPETGQYCGSEGLEYYYDSLLRGEPGYIMAQFYSSKNAIVPETITKKIEAKDGMNLVITIDKDVQYFVEERIKRVVEEYSARAATAIVMDSKTGEIYAMADFPSYDLNRYNEVKNIEDFLSLAYRGTYEPGSTFKTITVAAAIEKGVVGPETKLYLPSEIKIGKYTIKEAHHRAAGSYSVKEILQESMNIGAIRISEMIGPQDFYDFVISFGFGQKTGIDLNGEQTGRVLPPEQWKKTTLANMSFGQGLSCTPLQMLLATNVFANDGWLVKPSIMKYAYDPQTGSVQRAPDKERLEVVSRKTAKIVKDLLVNVVENGTGKRAGVPGYYVAGKTGTAQIAGPGGYQKGKYASSFVGFLPASDPAFSIIVVVYEPKGAYYGGVVAAPVFSDIASFLVKHYRIPPDRSDSKNAVFDLKGADGPTND